jgi:hypothetical protein
MLEQNQDFALDAIASAVRDRRCILFLGAGAHALPPDGSPFTYAAEHSPSMGSQLSRRLAAECALTERHPEEDATDLQRVSLFYEIARSRAQLIDAVVNAVERDRHPSPMLKALARLDFPIVITTNYDQMLERALRAAGKEPRVSVYTPGRDPTPDVHEPSVEHPLVFKIHGDVDRPETIVMTDEDYIEFVLRMSSKHPYDPIPLTLKYHLSRWTTLFVGYSLLDYNLRLLFKTLRWRIDRANIPDMFSVDRSPDPLILKVWEDTHQYVRFVAEDVWAFVPRLYQQVLGEELRP